MPVGENGLRRDGVFAQEAEVKVHRFVDGAGKLTHDDVYLNDFHGVGFLRVFQR